MGDRRGDAENALIRNYIEPNPNRPTEEDARILPEGVSVWAIIAHLRVVGNDALAVARDYEIPIEAVRAAQAYYRLHKRAIDARIEMNSDVTAA